MANGGGTQIVLFEDEAVGRLLPLTATRPVFELVAGAFTLRRRIASLAGRDATAALVRPHLAPALESLGLRDFRRAAGEGPWLFVNGAALPDAAVWAEIARLPRGEGWLSPRGRLLAFHCDDVRTVAALSRGKTSPRESGLRLREREGLRLVDHLWDLIGALEDFLADDLRRLLGRGVSAQTPGGGGLQGAFLDDAPAAGIHATGEAVFVREGAELLAPIACDAGRGPILIGREARVKPFSLLEGPLVIGEGATVLGGRVAGSYIGPGCRVHGEVSDSVFLGWANKAHEGFVGHSCVGEWVNLGALTTTSNLKNTYGTIRCWEEGSLRDSERGKLGAFLGDHVRTAIGTLLDSGSHIGTGANLVGAAGTAPKWVPSFVWGLGAGAEEYDWERFAAGVERAMSRRGRELQPWEREILRQAYDESAEERAAHLGESGAAGASRR